MNKILLISAISLIYVRAMSQINENIFNVRSIYFEIEHSRRIPNNKISVNINFKKECTVKLKSIPLIDDEQWQYTKIDTTFNISKNELEDIKLSLEKINPNDFLRYKEYSFKGGYTATLKYGGFGGNISYSFRSPNSRTETRGLNKYLCSCALILETAGFSKGNVSRFLGLKTPPQGCD